jgi:tetratricopeptide (TPR) repeat protein
MTTEYEAAISRHVCPRFASSALEDQRAREDRVFAATAVSPRFAQNKLHKSVQDSWNIQAFPMKFADVLSGAGRCEEAGPWRGRQLHSSFVGMGIALIELRRFDEAIVAGKKAQRQKSSYWPAYCCLASAFALLGRETEARELVARLLEFDPAFTISAFIVRGGQSNAKLLIEGLRKAGLPE